MKRRLHLWLLTIGLILLGQGKISYAQSPKTLEFGPHGGMTTSINDINTWKMFNQFDLELGGLVRFNYDSRWAFRADFTHAVLKGSDAVAKWRPIRDLNFRSVVNDVSLITEFNFLDYYTGRNGSSISPYLFGGISVFKYKVGPYEPDKAVLQTLAGSADRKILEQFNAVWSQAIGNGFSFSIPFGFGCKLSLSQHLAASLEWRMHYTFTDYLDGIADLYPADDQHRIFVSKAGQDQNGAPAFEYAVITGDPNNLDPAYLTSYDLTDRTGFFHEGQQRGNSQSKDWFGSLSLAITWKLPLPGGTACRIINY